MKYCDKSCVNVVPLTKYLIAFTLVMIWDDAMPVWCDGWSKACTKVHTWKFINCFLNFLFNIFELQLTAGNWNCRKQNYGKRGSIAPNQPVALLQVMTPVLLPSSCDSFRSCYSKGKSMGSHTWKFLWTKLELAHTISILNYNTTLTTRKTGECFTAVYSVERENGEAQ